MRSKIFIAFVATAITMSACEWLSTKKQANSISSIQGTWKLDSMSKANDSSKPGFAGIPLYFSNAELDSANIHCSFKTDTVIASVANKLYDTSSYTVDNSELTIKNTNDSTVEKFALNYVNDSAMSLMQKSSSYHFRRLQ